MGGHLVPREEWSGREPSRYWLIHKTSDAGESSTPHSKKRAALDLKRTRILEVKKELYPRDDSATLGSIKDVLYH